eukprot:TRINITY_DN565_c0_g1_i2.p1 TRINITY_DN565_c0_g1~~TRINITY_DN565_c0_g1_i2.p1  ORF type:complete len:559 (-),score=219.15 TRINITY_DN565_c0_g1_i2:432-2063(-)
MSLKRKDNCSISNTNDFLINHYDFHFVCDFEQQKLFSKVNLHFHQTQSPTQISKIFLDVLQLNINKIELLNSKQSSSNVTLTFTINNFESFGESLEISLPQDFNEKEFKIEIEFIASQGPALCWLLPSQTAGKVKPYLFTQGQACLNRSLFPCQDTPSVKATYNATVVTKVGFVALMSALRVEPFPQNKTLQDGNEVLEFKFEMKLPIPIYLVALAIGDLTCATIGPRSKVWTEPCLIKAAESEFADITEQYIQQGEKFFGPYVWQQYDILVMPPSFPYGGMENPCLTFLTPTLLVGDRSLLDVVIHEIIHSWFGNLVTNETWSDFWINEGFTMYGQRRIMKHFFGEELTALETLTGKTLLRECIKSLEPDSILSRLHVPLAGGINPDDVYNETPYEKGFAFVSYLEQAVGSIEKFDDWLKSYISTFAFKSLNYRDVLDHFLQNFPELKASGFEFKVGFEFEAKWLNESGFPVFYPSTEKADSLTKVVERVIQCWITTGNPSEDIENFSKWHYLQVCNFLDSLFAIEKIELPLLKSICERVTK